MAITQIVLTSGTSWTVPDDFDPNSNTVECIEGGTDGNKGQNGRLASKAPTGGDGGDSGAGGRFQGINNFQVNPGDVCTINIGASAGGSTGHSAPSPKNPTWISKTGSIPTITSDGCSASTASPVGDYGNNGGPAQTGSSNSGSTGGSGKAGGGAGGRNGAGSGATPGAMTVPWDGGIGPGTGGAAGGVGGAASNYGGGGGSGKGGNGPNTAGSNGGAGTQGVIVIRYTPRAQGGTKFRSFIFGM